MTDFSTLIPDARAFTAEVRANNTREWWQANKSTYDTKLKAPALALLETLAPRIEAETGHAAKPKLFRPHRDVRFSKDKTPYQTHLHMLWSLDAGGRQDPVIFFGIDPETVTVGIGVMQFDKAVLADWRRLLDLEGDRFDAVLSGAEAQGWSMWEPELKRVPSPHPADHPQATHLRRKSLVLHRHISPDSDPEAAIMTATTELKPVLGLLDSVL